VRAKVLYVETSSVQIDSENSDKTNIKLVKWENRVFRELTNTEKNIIKNVYHVCRLPVEFINPELSNNQSTRRMK